jgi:hypothetical protein
MSLWLMTRWLGVLGCSGEQARTWQESWELMVLAKDGSVLDLRWTHGNTGVLAGMGQARGELVARKAALVRFGYDGFPQEVEVLPEGLRIGPDVIERTGQNWNVVVREGTELDGFRDIRMTVTGDGQTASRSLDGFDWSLSSPELLPEASGALGGGSRYTVVQGPAVLLRRVGSENPGLSGERRRGVFVRDDGLSIGYDGVGSQALSWVVVDGERYEGASPLLSVEGKAWVLDFTPELPLVVQVTGRRPIMTRDPYEHLSGPEHWLVDRAGRLPRRVLQAATAELRWRDELRSAPALLLDVAYEDAEED